MDTESWHCPRCTFINHAEIRECECCNLIVEEEPKPKCCICNDPCDKTRSAVCSNRHVTCNECLQGLVQASLEPEKLRRDRGAVSCPWTGEVIGPAHIARCESNKFELEALRPLLSAETHAICTTKMRDFVAALMNAEANDHNVSASSSPPIRAIPLSSIPSTSIRSEVSRPDRIQRYRLRLAEALNLRCPRCAAVFFDYDGCDALKCQSCATAFCAICLKDCGNDAHPHVQQLHGRMHSSRDQFEAAHVERRAKIIAGALIIMDEPDDVKIDVLLALQTEMQPMQITRAAVLDNIPGGLGAAGDAIRERNIFGGLRGDRGRSDGGGGGGTLGVDQARREENDRAGFHDAEPSDPSSIVAGALLVGGIALVSAFLSDRPPPSPMVFEPLQRAVPNFLTTIFNNVYNNMCTVNSVLSTTETAADPSPVLEGTTATQNTATITTTAAAAGAPQHLHNGSAGAPQHVPNGSGAPSATLTTVRNERVSIGAGDDSQEGEAWTCSICTLINSSDSIECCACRHQRGSSRRKS